MSKVEGVTKPRLTLVTLSASYDEPCFELREVNLKMGKGFHRFRVYYVIRQDKLTPLHEDLGVLNLHKEQFRIPGGVIDESNGKFIILHTVGELIEIADYMNTQEPMSKNIEPRDLIGDYWKKQEEKQRRGKSSYGYKGHIQRD